MCVREFVLSSEKSGSNNSSSNEDDNDDGSGSDTPAYMHGGKL